MFLSNFVLKNKLLLLGGFLTTFVIAGAVYGYLAFNATKSSVKGVSTSAIPMPTVAQSLPPTSTPIPTPTNKPISVKAQVTPQAKQFGGWYWRSELGRAQRWLGTGAQGKDIWTDTGDPTPTPTKPSAPSTNHSETKIDELQFGVATDSQTLSPTPTSSSPGAAGSSIRGTSSMAEVQNQICSKDGSNPNVPKCL